MTISGKIVKMKALIVTPTSMKELCKILNKYSTRLSFEAKTYSHTDITFDTIDELLNYDNFKPRRIKELQITAYRNFTRVITVYIGKDFNLFHLTNYNETVNCSYQFDCVDDETLFKEKFNTWFDKAKSGYWLLGKFSFLATFCVPSILITAIRIGLNAPINADVSGLAILVAILAGGVFFWSAWFLDYHVLNNLFPPVLFNWGEESKRFEKWNKLRSNIFWGIIMALIIGLITSYLFDTIMKR